jgi:hypothetical protein
VKFSDSNIYNGKYETLPDYYQNEMKTKLLQHISAHYLVRFSQMQLGQEHRRYSAVSCSETCKLSARCKYVSLVCTHTFENKEIAGKYVPYENARYVINKDKCCIITLLNKQYTKYMNTLDLLIISSI